MYKHEKHSAPHLSIPCRISFPCYTALQTLAMRARANALHDSSSAHMEAGSWGSNGSGHPGMN